MVDFYVMMIRKGAITIDNVPELWRDDTEKALENM